MTLTKRVTIKDIAEKAGVSIGTVHCALAGKPGVGEETRLRIMDIAKLHGYRPNAVAASLKRKTIRIAAAFPGPTNENRFYFTYVWDGFHDYLSSMRDFKVEVLEFPYYNDAEGQAIELAKLLERQDVDGILTLGYMDSGCRSLLQRFRQRDIPMVLVGSDVPEAGRLCCVEPNYDVVGRTVAELLSWQASAGDVLLCAGNALTPAHYQICLGLEAYFEERDRRGKVIRVHDNGNMRDVYQDIVGALMRNQGISACCCVYARGSVMLGKALEKTGRAGGMPAIGCDVFEENIRFLERGTFTNLLHKNPYSQSYMAAKCLLEYLLKGVPPSRDTLTVGSEIVFRSALPLFQSGQRTLNAVIA